MEFRTRGPALRMHAAWGLLILAGVAAAALLVAVKRDPPLLARSRRVVDLQAFAVLDYGWRSPTRLVALASSGSGRMSRTDFAEIDLASARRRTLATSNPAFGRRLAKFGGFRISPRGRWLLAGTPSSSSDWFLALSLDSASAISPGPQKSWYPVSDAAWLRDENGSVCLSSDGGGLFAVMRSIRPASAARGPSFGFPTGTAHFDLLTTHILGQKADGRILCQPGDASLLAQGQGILPLFAFTPSRKAANVTESRVRLTGKPIVGEIALSPTGDRLAWLAAEQPRDAAVIEWLNRLFPKARPRRPKMVPAVIELCMSDCRGRGFRPIERITRCKFRQSTQVWESRGAQLPRLLRWLPDGKRVSFIYKDAIWTAPVD